jgi:alpha-amylase/alpha-mannosidase (GH57 family)
MKTVNFCFATHNHQPIGNFDYVIEEAYEKSYLPFFQVVSKYDLRFSTHFSGILLEWINKHHPEHISFLRTLTAKRQLDIISGGYYEPILTVFPYRDQLAQIAKLSTAIEGHFGAKPNGLWLAERIWEPQLPSVLSDAHIEYTILDDSHFRGAGLEEADLTGYYVTEDQGKSVNVFPISKALRYTIPFSTVDETIRILRDQATEKGENVITFADDGEKFGVWPQTYNHVYKDGWLEEFFRKLDENSSWLNTIHFRDAIKKLPPKGKIYLPTGSYAEMMEWSLPKADAMLRYESFMHWLSENKEQKEQYQQFVRGGFWRNFFVKYPESDHLHKRVLGVSEKFAVAKPQIKKTKAYRSAYDHLLAAQCNDPYWHGVFGGIYLANLRHEVYSNLLQAESKLYELEKRGSAVTKENNDLVILENKSLRIQIDLSQGGKISEIDFKSKAFNLSNFINRIAEASHQKLRMAETAGNSGESKSIHDQVLTKEKGLENYLIYDWYKHGSFIDHILSNDAKLEDLKKMSFIEHGDFFQAKFDSEIQGNQIDLTHNGNVSFNDISHSLTIHKSLKLATDSNILSAHIELRNNSNESLSFRYATEWTFGMLAGDADDRYYKSPDTEIKDRKMNSTGSIENATMLSLVDEWTGFRIDLKSEKSCSFWRTPIETVSLSEAGFERVYQGSIIFALWDISLKPGQMWDVGFEISVTSI